MFLDKVRKIRYSESNFGKGDVGMSPAGFGYAFVLIWFLVCGFGLGSQILLAFAVYYDAKAKNNSDPVMWALLTGFLGWIPAIIYLCMRGKESDRLIYCPQCGIPHRVSMPNCPQCGAMNPYAAPFIGPQIDIWRKRSKLCLIWAIVLFVLIFVVVFLIIFLMVAAVTAYDTMY